MPTNKAAWLPKPYERFEVRDGPEAEVGDNDVLVENKAIAMNPVDWKVQDSDMGIIKQFPTILGQDVAGIVVEVGSSVTKVKKGDRVCGETISLATGVPSRAGFQNFTLLTQLSTCPIPESLSFEQAAVVPLGLSTAAAGLYMKDFLALPYPKLGSTKLTGASVLIWGGSGSVGASAIQLAVASGFEVATTCSKKNFDFVKELGAKHVFDYSDSAVVENIVKALQGTKFSGAMDSVANEATLKSCGAVAEKLGASMVAATVPPPKGLEVGKDVVAKHVFAIKIILQEPEVGRAIWEDFLPGALASGQFKAKPDPMVAGHGVESIQDAVATLKKGVSAAKVVVTL